MLAPLPLAPHFEEADQVVLVLARQLGNHAHIQQHL